MQIIVVIPLTLFLIAVAIMRKENQFSFAPSIVEKPLGYRRRVIYWMLIPKFVKWASAIWMFFILRGLLAVAVPVAMLTLYSYLNRFYAKRAIIKSMEAIYPHTLAGIKEAHKEEELSCEQLIKMEEIAKLYALEHVWEQSTGVKPDESVMRALLKRTGLSRLERYL